MTFFTIVLRSLTRRPVRTCLTLVGISIGIAAVVALVGMAWGYEKGIGKQLDVMGIDVVVSNMSGGLMPKVFDESLQNEVSKLPRVAAVTSALMQMLSVEDAPIMMISGRVIPCKSKAKNLRWWESSMVKRWWRTARYSCP